MSDYFLEIKNLTKYFPLNNDVLSRLTGKSRILKAVDGTDHVSVGILDDHDVTECDAARAVWSLNVNFQ